MMDKYFIHFIQCDDMKENIFGLTFPNTTTVEDALNQFLKKANLMSDLSQDKIIFLCKGKMLNNPE